MASGLTSNFESIQQLLENPPDIFIDVSDLLLRFANNILNNPEEDKYRRLRVGNPIIETRLIPVVGAIPCLFEMGFQEDGDNFTLLPGTLLDRMRAVRDELAALRHKMLSGSSDPAPGSQTQAAAASSAVAAATASLPTGSTAAAAASASSSVPVSSSEASRRVQSTAMFKEIQLIQKLQTNAEHVLVYEDPRLQEKARSCIPLSSLREKAQTEQENLKKGCTRVADLQDLLLLQLLAWFKRDFFTWVNAPACEVCSSATESVGMATPNAEEEMWGAQRVENYRCKQCQRHTRFPRYNHPGRLLETRRGRCGEWANCFALCCRAVGFEARYVLDFTDHVWTEVYSAAQTCWLHCDACENTCDKPLLYEAGWNKKLTYVIAFSVDDVQDVTWRYSAKHREVMSRRTECRESLLLQTITRLRSARQKDLPEARRKVLLDRLVVELVEFLTIKVAEQDEQVGRSSGSTGWRSARGEIGNSAKTTPQPTVIAPTAAEVSSRVLHIKYSCVRDEYVRVSAGDQRSSGWGSVAYEVKDIHRKEELDWQKVYLSRAEGSETASLTWKFDFTESRLTVDQICIKAESKCYESGQVSWRLCGESGCAMLPPGGTTHTVDSLAGSPWLTLTADLSGGDFWQHTQLFRQDLADKDSYPLEVKVTLKDAKKAA